jgi:hypothetical protein
VTDAERIQALENRVLILEACLLEIEHKLKIKRRPGAAPQGLPPPVPGPVPSRSKPQRSGTPTGQVRRASKASS